MAKRACLLVALLGLCAADWPQYRGPQRDGVSRETGLLPTWPEGGPKKVWTFASAGLGYSGPAIVGEKLYMCGGRSDSDIVFCLNLRGDSPRESWAVKVGPLFTWNGNNWNAGPNVTPTVDGDYVYALGGAGDLVCVEASTGTAVWRKNLPREMGAEVNPIGGGAEEPTPLGWGFAWAPLVDGDRLICVPGGKQGLLAALDKKTGKLLWRTKDVTDQASYSSPVLAEIGGLRQVVQVTNHRIVGVAVDDGRLLWSYVREPAYDDVVIATPIVRDNFVFSSVGFQQGCDLIKLVPNGKTIAVEKIISDKSVQNRDGGMVLVGDHVYGHSENGGWFCMEFKTGKIVWSERDKLGRGSITAVDGKLICCSEMGGTVVMIDATPKGWTELGRFKLGQQSKERRPSGGMWTHPVVANGRLYIRDQELLSCYELKP